jgi:hypothetical protein
VCYHGAKRKRCSIGARDLIEGAIIELGHEECAGRMVRLGPKYAAVKDAQILSSEEECASLVHVIESCL